jgi:hypothetical protein
MPSWVDSNHTEYGEHLLPPVVEFPSFCDDVAFVAAADTELRDGPLPIAPTVANVHAGDRLVLSVNKREEWWGYTTAIWQGGDLGLVWAHVDTEAGVGAWARLPDLRWAIGVAL